MNYLTDVPSIDDYVEMAGNVSMIIGKYLDKIITFKNQIETELPTDSDVEKFTLELRRFRDEVENEEENLWK